MAGYDQLQDLIGEIYDAALDPARWTSTLDHLAAAFGGNAVAISDKSFRDNSSPTFIIQAGFCDEIVKLYVEHYIKVDLRFDIGRHLEPGAIIHEPMFITEAEMDRSDYYQEFLGPFDFRYHAGGVLENSDDIVAAITVQRSPRAGAFGPDELKGFSLLFPHVRRALLIQRRLATLQRRERILVEMLDRLPSGVVILDGKAQPALMNRAAQSIIASGDGLMSGPDGLCACRPAETAMLRRLVADALATSLGEGTKAGGSVYLPRPSGKAPLIASIVPSGPALSLELALAGPHVLMFVSDPDMRPRIALAPSFIRFYGLTRAEARLLQELVNGASPEQARNRFGVSMATVRKHLQAIFAKIGVNRQTDLVRLVLSSPLQFTADRQDET